MLADFDMGKFKLETEPDFIRAMSAMQAIRHAWSVYNADWIVLRNDTDYEFLTSDNPVAFDDPGPWRGGTPGFPSHLPVTPRLCLRFDMSQYGRSERRPDFTRPPKGKIRVAAISLQGVRHINRAVVLCAEEIVLSSQTLPSVEALVVKYARYRVSAEFIQIREPKGFLGGMHIRVREPSPATVIHRDIP